jgi:hypothetical protein
VSHRCVVVVVIAVMCVPVAVADNNPVHVTAWWIGGDRSPASDALRGPELRVAGQPGAGLQTTGEPVAEGGVARCRQRDVVPAAGLPGVDRDLACAVQLDLMIAAVGVGDTLTRRLQQSHERCHTPEKGGLWAADATGPGHVGAEAAPW